MSEKSLDAVKRIFMPKDGYIVMHNAIVIIEDDDEDRMTKMMIALRFTMYPSFGMTILFAAYYNLSKIDSSFITSPF